MMKDLAISWKTNLPNQSDSINVSNIFVWVYMIMGVLALAFLLYGVIVYISSRGDPSGVARGKSIIMYSIVGLVIVILASAITLFVEESL